MPKITPFNEEFKPPHHTGEDDTLSAVGREVLARIESQYEVPILGTDAVTQEQREIAARQKIAEWFSEPTSTGPTLTSGRTDEGK